jgi:prolyl oligopeptidase
LVTPPPTRRDLVVDTLHGVEVADPYRWLEDGESDEVQQWVAAQNRQTRRILDSRPDRNTWHERLIALMELPVVLAAEVRGDVLVTMERRTGEQQASLVVRSAASAGATRLVLVDPAAGAADAAVAVDWFSTSPEGSLVAYGVSEGGTENSVLRVIRTADASHLVDEIPNTRACTVGWEPDASGFAYTRYPAGDEYHRTHIDSEPTGATTPCSGRITPLPRPGPTSSCQQTAATCSSSQWSDGADTTSTCSTARPASGPT